jgi:mRNA interferase RelE/StbE
MELEIYLSHQFKKSFKKLSSTDQEIFFKKMDLFINDSFHPSFRTKHLHGSKVLMESSINMSIRVIWRYETESLILFLDIGHHDILRRL